MNIIHAKNPTNKTPFAAQWDYLLCEDDLSNRLNLSNIADVILKNEKDIIRQYVYEDDWGTGLGPNSMTSRSNRYNLLKWPELIELKLVIRNTHDKFLSNIGLPPEEVIYLQCWANVLRKGQGINKHRHWGSPYAYLGGHICIQQTNTHTYYKHPYTDNNYSSINEPGKITLFPNWIEHWTDTHTDDQERITIAFDIITKVVFDEDIAAHMKDHWVPITD
jgi:hypothetical protein